MHAQQLYDQKTSLEFSKYLMQNGHTKLAQWELEKIIRNYPENDTISGLLLQTYACLGTYEEGVLRTKRLFERDTLIPPFTAVNYGKLLALSEQDAALKQFLDQNHFLNLQWKNTFSIHSAISKKQWTKADSLIQTYKTQMHYSKSYETMISNGMKYRERSPFIAGTMSTIIPGTGKMYSGFIFDGLVSLLSVSISAWQTYQGFSVHGTEDSYGWIFGSITTVLYFSNIHGSVKAAKYRNDYEYQKIMDQANDLLRNDFDCK